MRQPRGYSGRHVPSREGSERETCTNLHDICANHEQVLACVDRGENPDAFLKHQLDHAKSINETMNEKAKALEMFASNLRAKWKK